IATDNCDPSPMLTHNYDTTDLNGGAQAQYDITITFTATDACGNDSIASFIITVVPDTIAPEFTVPANVSIDCSLISSTASPAAFIDSLIASVIATDNCDPSPMLTHNYDT